MCQIINEDINKIIEADLPWQELSGKTVLITGASGLLPAYLVETLLHLNKKQFYKKVHVIGIVKNQKYARNKFMHHKNNEYLNLLKSDVNDLIQIDSKIDIIIHAASHASPKYYAIDPVGTLLPNITGTKNLLELGVKKKIKSFLFFSSGEVYGKATDVSLGTGESSYGWLDPMDVRSCYAESKRMGETMCVAWGKQYGFDVKVVRPFHTYGPGMKLDDGRVFADFVSNIVNGEDIVMKSDGSHKRPFCYISDATVGFLTVLLKGESANAYNIANPMQNVSIKTLAEMLIDLFPEKRLKVKSATVNQSQYMRSPITEQLPDISKLIKLGWMPKIDIREGFYRTIRSYL